MELLIKFSKGKSLKKSWRLRETPLPTTVGSSPKAGVHIPGCNGIEAAFEYRDGSWWYLPMNLSDSTTSESIQIGKEPKAIQIGQHSLQVCAVKPRRKPDTENLPRIPRTETLGLNKVPEQLTQSDRRIIGATIAVPMLLLIISFFLPDSSTDNIAQEFDRAPKVIAQTRVEQPKPEPPKKKAQAPKSEKVSDGKSMKAPKTASTAQAKANSPVLGIRKGSLSNLVGKVSSRAAVSREVVVATSGRVAGTQPSSRAFAVAGAVSQQAGQSGMIGMGEGTGVTVSTVGRGGGSDAYHAMGTLKDGQVGRGNLDIIEEETEIGGGLAREIIASYIKSQLGHILYCYERQLSATPNLNGQVSVRFTIGATGKVVAQNIGSTTLKNATVEGCILRKVAEWKFPQPEGGTQVNVTYPFLFKSTR